jgi:hypothetical protein
MSQIIPEGQKGEKGGYFKSEDLVGLPFEIMEDVNALSNFRETEINPPKPGEKTKPPYQIFLILCNGETKDWHMTMSNLRQVSGVMPPGIATWKGQRLVMNALGNPKTYTKSKFTRLMGDYVMPPGQQAPGQPMPSQPPANPANNDPILAPVLKQLVFASGVYPDGIPMALMTTMTVNPDVFQALKDKGMIFEPKPGFFKVVV